MALHRDIHWIGRQWAVTGHGMQLIDQKLKGFFDIEVPRLWEDAFIAEIRAKEWLNRADFDRGLAVARKRFSQTPDDIAPPRAETVETATPVAPIKPKPLPKTASDARSEPARPSTISKPPEPTEKLADPVPALPNVVAPPEPDAPTFQMRFDGVAKLVRPWRVRSRK